MEKTVVELFAGVGGFRCGFNHVTLEDGVVHEDDTWDFVWANQWEPSTKTQAAYDCYVERFGESENHVNEDIAAVDKTKIPNHTLLVGGFPCQDYSVARSLSNEKGIEGKKGVLWWQIAEVLEEKRPPFVLLENVDRLLKSPSFQRGRDFGVMLRTLLDNGYSVEWRVINAAEYGFPQRRRRVFIFAYHKSTNYYKKMDKVTFEDLIYNKGIFAQNFPIKLNKSAQTDLIGNNLKTKDEFHQTNISNKEFRDLVDLSDNFSFSFLNAGLMHKGNIYTFKTEPDFTYVGNQDVILLFEDEYQNATEVVAKLTIVAPKTISGILVFFATDIIESMNMSAPFVIIIKPNKNRIATATILSSPLIK